MLFSNPEPATQPTKIRGLTDLCEPFFLEVCSVIRSVGPGGDREAYLTRDRLKRKLDALLERAQGASNNLAEDYRLIEPVLAIFADVVIADSRLPYAAQWIGPVLLANEPRINVKNGREEFFKLLSATLGEASKRATQRLAIFQTCLGLGFGGIYRDNPGKLKEFSSQILNRLSSDFGMRRERAKEGYLCPEAYDATQADQLCRPVAEKIAWIGILCVALLLATVVAYAWVYGTGIEDIDNVLGGISNAAL